MLRVIARVTLAGPGEGEFLVVGREVPGHLLSEDLLKDGLNAFSDSRLCISLGILAESLVWGQVRLLTQPPTYQGLSVHVLVVVLPLERRPYPLDVHIYSPRRTCSTWPQTSLARSTQVLSPCGRRASRGARTPLA